MTTQSMPGNKYNDEEEADGYDLPTQDAEQTEEDDDTDNDDE